MVLERRTEAQNAHDPEEPEPVDPPVEAEAPQSQAAPPIDTEQPRVGPKIVGMAEEKPPPIAVIKRLQDPRRPRRKRPNAAEKHRRAFFARLNELRGSRSAPKRCGWATGSVPSPLAMRPTLLPLRATH